MTNALTLKDVLKERNEKQKALEDLEKSYLREKKKLEEEIQRTFEKEEIFMQTENQNLLSLDSYVERINNSENLIFYAERYLRGLKREIIKNWENLRRENLEIQDNTYGGNSTKYTQMVEKGYTTRYHPDLGSIRFSENAPEEYFDILLLEINKLLDNKEAFKIQEISEYRIYDPDRIKGPYFPREDKHSILAGFRLSNELANFFNAIGLTKFIYRRRKQYDDPYYITNTEFLNFVLEDNVFKNKTQLDMTKPA